MAAEFEELDKIRENPELDATPLVEFSDEEGYGKYLDLHEMYQKYSNLKGVEVSQKITYILITQQIFTNKTENRLHYLFDFV